MTRFSYAERLLDAMNAAGLNRRKLALAIGISEQAVGNVINGGANTSFIAKNSAEAAKVLGVEHYWLATGKGPRLAGDSWPFKNVQFSEVAQLTEPERLQLEGAMRLMLSQLWRDRHGGPDPHRGDDNLPAPMEPLSEVPPEFKALAERQRILEEAMRAAANSMMRAAGGAHLLPAGPALKKSQG